jgi:hypothetical protein
VSFKSRDVVGADTLAFALTAWAAESGNATVERADTVVLTACGEPPVIDEHTLLAVDAVAAIRNQVVALGFREGGTESEITCVARQYAGDPRLVSAFADEQPDGRVSRKLENLIDQLRATAARACGVPLQVVRDSVAGGRENYEAKLILVRPDQFVAFAGDTAPADPDALMRRVSGQS